MRRAREAGLVVASKGDKSVDPYELALRAIRAHRSIGSAALDLAERGTPIHPKAIATHLDAARAEIDRHASPTMGSLEKAEHVVSELERRLGRSKIGRAWRRRARAHKKALEKVGQPAEADDSYVQGGLTTAIYLLLRGEPVAESGLEEFFILAGWRSTETHPVATAEELAKPLRALRLTTICRRLRTASPADLASAREDAGLFREWLVNYVACARLLYGTTEPVSAYAAALPIIENTPLGVLTAVVLAMRPVFGTRLLDETFARLRRELATMHAGLALADALEPEFHVYLRDEASLTQLEPAEQLRVRRAIAAAGFSLPTQMQEQLIQSALAA